MIPKGKIAAAVLLVVPVLLLVIMHSRPIGPAYLTVKNEGPKVLDVLLTKGTCGSANGDSVTPVMNTGYRLSFTCERSDYFPREISGNWDVVQEADIQLVHCTAAISDKTRQTLQAHPSTEVQIIINASSMLIQQADLDQPGSLYETVAVGDCVVRPGP